MIDAKFVLAIIESREMRVVNFGRSRTVMQWTINKLENDFKSFIEVCYIRKM